MKPYRSYAEYLRTPEFAVIRRTVMTRARGLCERTGCASRATEVHHFVYPPWGTFDLPYNMIAICHPCHCRIHGKTS